MKHSNIYDKTSFGQKVNRALRPTFANFDRFIDHLFMGNEDNTASIISNNNTSKDAFPVAVKGKSISKQEASFK